MLGWHLKHQLSDKWLNHWVDWNILTKVCSFGPFNASVLIDNDANSLNPFSITTVYLTLKFRLIFFKTRWKSGSFWSKWGKKRNPTSNVLTEYATEYRYIISRDAWNQSIVMTSQHSTISIQLEPWNQISKQNRAHRSPDHAHIHDRTPELKVKAAALMSQLFWS